MKKIRKFKGLPKGWSMYMFDYDYDGLSYSINVPARSADEARLRLKLASEGEFVGTLYAEYPYHMGWWVRLTVALRNLLGVR